MLDMAQKRPQKCVAMGHRDTATLWPVIDGLFGS